MYTNIPHPHRKRTPYSWQTKGRSFQARARQTAYTAQKVYKRKGGRARKGIKRKHEVAGKRALQHQFNLPYYMENGIQIREL